MKLKWWWHTLLILAPYIAHYIAVKLNYNYVNAGWFLTFTTAYVLGIYFIVFALDRLYDQEENNFRKLATFK